MSFFAATTKPFSINLNPAKFLLRSTLETKGAIIFVVYTSRGEQYMRKTLKTSRLTVAPVYTTRSGSRYVRSIDVIRSDAGRRELFLQLKNQPKNSRSYVLKAARWSNTKS